MDALRTLETLVTSRTPLIAVETQTEERGGQVVGAALYTALGRGVRLSTEPLSVTRAEEVEDLREWARGRAVPAS